MVLRRPLVAVVSAIALASLAATAVAGAAPSRARSRGDHGILVVRYSTASGAHIYLWKRGRRPYRLTWGRHDWSGEPTWSPDGRLVAFSGGDEPNNPPANCIDADGCRPEIWVMRANGSHKRLLTGHDPAQYTDSPSWSPDGRRIVFVRDPGFPSQELAVVSLRTGRERALGASGEHPAWGPDGIAFAGRRAVRLLDPETGRSRILARSESEALAWSPDGSRLASISLQVRSHGMGTPRWVVQRVVVFSASGKRLSRFRLTARRAGACLDGWSPDGTHLLLAVAPRMRGPLDQAIPARLYEVDTAGRNWRRLPVATHCDASWR